MSVIPSVLWWNNTMLLAISLFVFMGLYVLLYWSIVHFKTPSGCSSNARSEGCRFQGRFHAFSTAPS
jgi:hypothetical protein